MASLVITDAGISIKSFRELRVELQEEWAKAFGDAIDLSPTSVDGHHLDLECKTITSVSQLIQAVADNLDPSKATGVWLDILGDYKSMTRISASYSVARVTFVGTNGTVIPEGTAVRYYGAPCDFTLQEEITIGSDGTALGECVADTIGYVEVFVGDWQLVSDIEGVTCKVVQGNAGGAGRNDETDAEYRARQKKYTGGGLATYDKMYAYMAGVVGEGNFTLEINDEDITQNGIPPHRFEFVINNGIGTNDELAQAIWACKAGGIKPFGNTSGTAVAVNKVKHTMYFSRPVDVKLWLSVTITEYTEETLPDNYSDAIKDAVFAFAETEYTPGKDVILERLKGPIYQTVSGIRKIVVKGCVKETQPTPEEYSEDDIAVAPRSVATVQKVDVTLSEST